jgi:hypothetical protein
MFAHGLNRLGVFEVIGSGLGLLTQAVVPLFG